MDRNFESDNLGMFLDWNEEDFQPTFLQTDTPLTGLEDANLMEHFNSQTELPPLPPTIVEPMTEITDPASWSFQGFSSGAALGFVPTPLPPLLPNTPLLNEPQLNPSLLSAEGLMFDGAVPSDQSQDMTLAEYFNQLSELQNANSVAHEQFQFSASTPDVYGAQYAPNHTQFPQPFTPVQNQIGHSHTQQIMDLHSQHSRSFVYPRCPRLESYANLQPGLVTMPPNPLQQGYRSVLPDPAAPLASSVANYGQNPSLYATSSNSFGSGSSALHPKYPQLYESQYQHHRPQFMMPNDQGQQSGSSMQQWSQGVPNQIGEYNRRMMTPNLQRPINTSSQTLISRFLGHSSSRTTEGTSSRIPNSRDVETAAPALRLQQEATVLPNEVPNSRDKGKQPETSSTRSQPSEAIQRILNMNPSRMITQNISITGDQSGSMPTERVPYVPPRRGRPPKRRDPIESYSERAKSLKVCTETGKHGSTGTSQTLERTPHGVVIRDPSAVLPNPPSAPRNFENAAYDMEFERQGQPLEPHLRFFKPPPEN